MLRKNNAATISDRHENATWPTSRLLATVILLRLLPAVRASSFSASATLARDARRAGIIPNRKPVRRETPAVKTNTIESSFGVIRFDKTSGGRNDHKSCRAAYPIAIPTT